MNKNDKYYTLEVKNLINSGVESLIDNEKAVYLFKYNFKESIDFTSEDTVSNGIISLIEQVFYEKQSSFLGLFFNTTVELSSKRLPENKLELLDKLIQKDKLNNYKNVKHMLDIITDNQQPLYVGKANKLANRIKQHLEGNGSDLRGRLETYDIDIDRCLLSYHYIDDNLDNDMNLLFEDIITRILKPGFVRRIG